MFADFYNYPDRFSEKHVTVQLRNVVTDQVNGYDFDEFHILENALWVYRQYLLQLINEGKGHYQNRAIPIYPKDQKVWDAEKELDDKDKVAKKHNKLIK